MKPLVAILGSLCALALAADFGPPLGSRLSGIKPAVIGPHGAVVLFGGSNALIAELDAHREAFQKLGVGVTDQPGPRPGWFVLDAEGAIAAKYFQEGSGQCYTSAAVLVHRFGWTPKKTQTVEARQLTATIAASDSSVAPEELIALTLDIDLGPNMHVYAPGVDGYIPIDWKMEDSAAAHSSPAMFPRAEKLYLKAIDETVPAYRNHFRLTRDVAIASGAPEAFALDGSLRYQACDDRLCYIPQTMRLHWTFQTAR